MTSNEVMNDKIAPAAIPGLSSGSTTYRNAENGLAPNVRAALSNVRSLRRWVEITAMTTNGIEITVWASATPKRVPIR